MRGCQQRELRRQSPAHHQHPVPMGPVVQRTEGPSLCGTAHGCPVCHPCRSGHPSTPVCEVFCLTVWPGRSCSRVTLPLPLSLALMSPDGSDRERSPLEPVKDNILLVAGEPPPLGSTS